MDNKNTETETEQLQEELLAEITEHDVAAPVIANRKEEAEDES